ncbi:hypothetical protein J6590_022376 [Homalodisca vitripennis]|nr:hypothetical protein J6590_022376 [Homalodisca vitripennis]
MELNVDVVFLSIPEEHACFNIFPHSRLIVIVAPLLWMHIRPIHCQVYAYFLHTGWGSEETSDRPPGMNTGKF